MESKNKFKQSWVDLRKSDKPMPLSGQLWIVGVMTCPHFKLSALPESEGCLQRARTSLERLTSGGELSNQTYVFQSNRVSVPEGKARCASKTRSLPYLLIQMKLRCIDKPFNVKHRKFADSRLLNFITRNDLSLSAHRTSWRSTAFTHCAIYPSIMLICWNYRARWLFFKQILKLGLVLLTSKGCTACSMLTEPLWSKWFVGKNSVSCLYSGGLF